MTIRTHDRDDDRTLRRGAADLAELLRAALPGGSPTAVIEALLDRMEGRA